MCIFLHNCTHSVRSGITTGRTPTFIFALWQEMSVTGPDITVHNNMAVNATTPRTSCLLSAGLPGHPQNCFLVILLVPSPSSPTFSDGDPLRTVSTLQHFNKQSHAVWTELYWWHSVSTAAQWCIPHHAALYIYWLQNKMRKEKEGRKGKRNLEELWKDKDMNKLGC